MRPSPSPLPLPTVRTIGSLTSSPLIRICVVRCGRDRDFDAPLPTTLDTSSSLILSSALLLLSSIEASRANASGATFWAGEATTLLGSVVQLGVDGWTGDSLVGNGTVNNRAVP